jgi:uncharacterized membrane protein YkoI
MGMSGTRCRLVAAVWTVLGAAPAFADETAALPDAGGVMPLSAVLDRVMPVIEGEIGGTKLIKDGGVWIYVISFFDEDGARRELKVDATTAAILGINTKPK